LTLKQKGLELQNKARTAISIFILTAVLI
jgi:hypothetical protein